jgi:hypothetical protein
MYAVSAAAGLSRGGWPLKSVHASGRFEDHGNAPASLTRVLIDSVSVGPAGCFVGIDARQPAVNTAAINAATRDTCVPVRTIGLRRFSAPAPV